MMAHVGIVGGGIIGMSTAVALQERLPGVNITVLTDEISPNTTADGSAGLWGPYLLGDTPDEDIKRWASETHKLFARLWRQPDGGQHGVSLIPMCRVERGPSPEDPPPIWADIVFGCRPMSQKELDELKPGYTRGYSFVSFTCEPVMFLPYLMRRFQDGGGIIERTKVTQLSPLGKRFNVIVNSSGIGARELVPDYSVQPIRGQVMRVEAPWVFRVILDDSDDGNYIISNQKSVVIGGTHQVGNWNRNPDPTDTKFIVEGCRELLPSLKYAKPIKEWVGLRPGRPKVRIEREVITDSAGQKLQVVHNYGHGGSGVTMCWGCALDAVKLIEESLHKSGVKIQTKL